jgi:hypothetical protein
MSDHRRPGENPDIQGRLQGAVPAHHILLWICNETWNDLALPILRGLELLGDRGRRPHVPSSKPTMSKSRHISLPSNPGHRLAVKRDATGLGRDPAPSVKAHIWRTGPTVNGLLPENSPRFAASFVRVVPNPENRARHPAEMGRRSRPCKAEAHRNFKENSGLSDRDHCCERRYGRPAGARQGAIGGSSPARGEFPIFGAMLAFRRSGCS